MEVNHVFRLSFSYFCYTLEADLISLISCTKSLIPIVLPHSDATRNEDDELDLCMLLIDAIDDKQW